MQRMQVVTKPETDLGEISDEIKKRKQKPLVRIVCMRLSSVMVSGHAVSNAGSPSDFSQKDQ